MAKILFICTGNTCRSPMAEYLLRQMISEKSELKDRWEVMSAGIFVLPGEGPNQNAIKVLKEEGINLKNHFVRQIDEELIKDVDLILTMTEWHKERIMEMNPGLKGKVFTLKGFAGLKSNLDISDPFGQSLAIYRKTRDEIKIYLKNVLGRLNQFFLEEGNKKEIENNIYKNDEKGGKKMKIAIGSDHAGYALKKIIIDLLQELAYNFMDMGTDSSRSVDYPDFAYKVANAVATGEYDRGILICGTGIGMSISANKIKGVRAALCHDLFSAKASRNHNNSNVLALGARVVGDGLAKEIVKVWLDADFDGDRHAKRIEKIELIERGEYKENE